MGVVDYLDTFLAKLCWRRQRFGTLNLVHLIAWIAKLTYHCRLRQVKSCTKSCTKIVQFRAYIHNRIELTAINNEKISFSFSKFVMIFSNETAK